MVKNKNHANLDCTQNSSFSDNLQMLNPLNFVLAKKHY